MAKKSAIQTNSTNDQKCKIAIHHPDKNDKVKTIATNSHFLSFCMFPH